MAWVLVGIGACYLDTILDLDYSAPKAHKLHTTKRGTRLSGSVPITLQVLTQLLHYKQQSLCMYYVASLPNRGCSATQQIQTVLGPNVNTGYCQYKNDLQDIPATYIIRNLAKRTRTLVDCDYGFPEITSRQIENVAANLSGVHWRDSLWYHLEGENPEITSTVIDYLRCRHRTAMISIEVGNTDRPDLIHLASRANVVFYSQTWARAEGYSDPKRFLKAQARLLPYTLWIFCTWGAEGAAAYNVVYKRYFHDAGLRIKEPLDTVDARHAFIAAILFTCLDANGWWKLKDALKFANKVAGRKVAQEGVARLVDAIVSNGAPPV